MRYCLRTLPALVGLFLLFLFPPLAAHAETSPEKTYDNFTFYWENDLFSGNDRDYSNGLKGTWSTPYTQDGADSSLPQWSYPIINALPFVSDPAIKRAVSFSIGQDIYTPEDTQSEELVVDDRPYAGMSYVAAGFHGKKGNRKSSWELSLGFLGPISLAQQSQNLIHDVTGSDRAQGWDNQLENEITLDVTWESQWQLLRAENTRGFSYDFIPHLGARVGTVKVYANAGGEVRFGWNLPTDFGSCPIRAGCETNSSLKTGFGGVGVHVFTSVDGKIVLRDIFLDGNTFKDSHSVDREPFVADLMAGIGFQYKNVKATYSYVYRTKEFEEQERNQVFGSISIAFAY